jgi:DNA-binding transcriptional LysR family regulator
MGHTLDDKRNLHERRQQPYELTHLLRSQVKLKHLQFIVAISEQLHIGRVAEQMHLSQPTASKTLAEIESLVGARLFDRTSTGLVQTAQGKVFVEFAREMLSRMMRLGQELAAAQLGFAGTVSVGAQLGAAMVVPLAIKILKEESPRTTVRLDAGLMEPLIEKLRLGEYDMVVGRLDSIVDATGITLEPLYDDAVMIVASPKSTLARKRNLQWSDLAGHPWVLPPQESLARSSFNRAAVEVGLQTAEDLVETGSFLALITLVRERDSLAVLSESVARFCEASSLLKVLPLPAIRIGNPVGIARLEGREPGPSVALFTRCLREAATRTREEREPSG